MLGGLALWMLDWNATEGDGEALWGEWFVVIFLVALSIGCAALALWS